MSELEEWIPFNLEEWSKKIKEASAKWFEDNPNYSPALNYYDSGEVTLPGDRTYYRVPMDLWYDYHEALYNCKIDR